MTESTILERIVLVPASVPREATYGEAADVLAASGQTGIAVLAADDRVVGLFGAEQALRGCLPRYLDELHHTAFARDDLDLLADLAARTRAEPIERHMAAAVTVERDASALHIGEVFLHCRRPAIAVVDAGRFVGILDRAAFARAMILPARGSTS